MSDENPFDDLGGLETESNAVEPDERDSEQVESTEQVDGIPPNSSAGETASSADDGSEPADDGEPDLSGPAFEYDAVKQRPLYVRERTWDAFEDAIGISVVPELRKEGVRDESKREIHDAAISLVAEEPERLVEILLERRREP